MPSSRPPVARVASSEGRNLTYWRERTLRALLRTASVMGLFAYVPSVRLAYQESFWSIVIVDTVAYAALVGVTVWPGAPYRLRAATLTSMSYLLGTVLLVAVGMTGSGMLWLSSGPIFVSLLLGLRAAARAVAVNVTILLVIGGGIAAGWLTYAPAPWSADGGLALFVVAATNATLLAAAISVSVGVLLNGLEAGHAELTHEIEERTRAEAGQRRLEEQLREAHKLEAVGRLASGVAHDFNNLLVPILANAQEMRRHVDGADPRAGALDDIVLSAERGRSLVQRVLAFGRRSITTRRSVVIAEVLREAAQLLRAGLPTNIELVVAVEGDELAVFADPVELHQVVMNLGTNAGHAMRLRGGTLTLEQRSGAPGSVLIRVVDTGEGMSPAVRERAFEPFFTTKSLGEGSGLGLSTVFAIVAELGGRMEIESRPGGGTTVEVSLPRITPGAVHPDADPVPHDQPAGPAETAIGAPDDPTRKPRVLVVDDEALVVKTCALVLTRLGYEVRTSTSPQEAAEMLRTSASEIDLLITDKAMPGLDGLTLARLARRWSPTLPILLATGYLDEATAAQVEEIGAVRVIHKPFHIEDLARVAAAALSQRS